MYLGTSTAREHDKIDRKMSLPFRKTGYINVTKSKEKKSSSSIYHSYLICSLLLLLTMLLQLVANYSNCFPYLLDFASI